MANDLITAELVNSVCRSNSDLLDALWMSAAEIGRVLNPRGSGRCPWCGTGGPMVVGVHGVAWLCGHARRLPPLHSIDTMVARCPQCTPQIRLRAVA